MLNVLIGMGVTDRRRRPPPPFPTTQYQAMEKKKREKLAEMGMTLEEFEEMKARQKEEERAKRREAKRNATMSEDYKCVR